MRGGWRVQPTAFLNTAEVPENHFTAEENKTRSRMRYWLVTPNRNPCVFLSLRRPNIDALDELALENEVERYRRDEANHRCGEDETVIGRVLRREADETCRTIGLEKSDAMQLEDAPAAVQAIGEAAWQVNRDAMLLCHGGPIATPGGRRVCARALRRGRLRWRILDGTPARRGRDRGGHARL